MENQKAEQQKVVNQVYEFAGDLIIKEKKTSEEVIEILIENGLERESATIIVKNIKQQIADARHKKAKEEVRRSATKAKNDMIFGAIWCVGGIIATIADLGYIFWGAIIFGGYQFFRGWATNSA